MKSEVIISDHRYRQLKQNPIPTISFSPMMRKWYYLSYPFSDEPVELKLDGNDSHIIVSESNQLILYPLFIGFQKDHMIFQKDPKPLPPKKEDEYPITHKKYYDKDTVILKPFSKLLEYYHNENIKIDLFHQVYYDISNRFILTYLNKETKERMIGFPDIKIDYHKSYNDPERIHLKISGKDVDQSFMIYLFNYVEEIYGNELSLDQISFRLNPKYRDRKVYDLSLDIIKNNPYVTIFGL